MGEHDLALMFLARGADGGRAAAEAFFESYRRHPAGCPHALIVLAKGWDGVPGLDGIRQTVADLGGKVIDLPDDGFDLGAYFRAMPLLPHQLVCPVNTHSRILADGWLRILRDAAEQPGVGAAGATGSWESKSTVEWRRWRAGSPLYRLRHLGRLIRETRTFPPFPNPALRTNAFVTRRSLLQEFAATVTIPRNRSDAGMLESGRRGYSAFLRDKNLRLMVAGADGRAFPEAEWAASGTFRVPGQPNLLVSDNRTRAYAEADPATARRLSDMAWRGI